MRFLKKANIDFLGNRKTAFVISLILTIGSISLFFIKPPVLGIDFSGGSLVYINYEKAQRSGEIKDILDKLKLGPITVQQSRQSNTAIIRTQKEVSDEKVEKIIFSLNEKYPQSKFEQVGNETVGPAVGSYLKEKAIKAFIFAFIGMIIYVAWRFKGGIWGLAAVIALVHDVIITFGVLNFLQVTVNLPVVAALLTLAGYSINDSIVIYDRIRENIKLHYKKNIKEIVNTSINSTLSRTIITSGTTLMVILALFFKGGEVLRGFSITLLVGIIIGTYSSIFVASPLVYAWQVKSE